MIDTKGTERLLCRLTQLEQALFRGEVSQREFARFLAGRQEEGLCLHRWYGPQEEEPVRWLPGATPELDEKNVILSGGDVWVTKHKSYDSTPPHTHNFYELVAVLQGVAANQTAGREFLLRRGHVFLLRPGAAHSISCSSDGVVLNILIRPAFFQTSLPALFGPAGLPAGFFSPQGPSGRYCLFDAGEEEEIRQLLLLLAREALTDRPNRRAAMNGALIFLFSLLFDRCGAAVEQEKPPSRYQAAFQRLFAYLAGNYQEASLQGAADHLHFSTRHVDRICQEGSGRGFTRLLQEVRVEAAKRLLEETGLPVEEVGRAVGFSEGGYFIRIFRRLQGVTPSAYRRRYREDHNI